MTSSRAKAQTWPYPRHRDFEQSLRLAAAQWFAAKGRAVNARYPYILAEWEQWPENIIVPDVVKHIQEEWTQRHAKQQGFPLHKWLHHGLSSQAMLFNLVGPLIVDGHLAPLQEALAQQRITCPEGAINARFEYENRKVFNEDSGQPTSLDLIVSGDRGSPPLFIEAKLVEREFGGCSVFEAGDCDGRNPAKDFTLCYLHHLGRSYWDLMARHNFLTGPIGENATCILSTYYQFFREVVFALQLGGIFVLLSDERSPTFSCRGSEGQRGLMPFLLSLMPPSACARVATVSIQQVVAAIKASNRHDWIVEFEHKYDLQ